MGQDVREKLQELVNLLPRRSNIRGGMVLENYDSYTISYDESVDGLRDAFTLFQKLKIADLAKGGIPSDYDGKDAMRVLERRMCGGELFGAKKPTSNFSSSHIISLCGNISVRKSPAGKFQLRFIPSFLDNDAAVIKALGAAIKATRDEAKCPPPKAINFVEKKARRDEKIVADYLEALVKRISPQSRSMVSYPESIVGEPCEFTISFFESAAINDDYIKVYRSLERVFGDAAIKNSVDKKTCHSMTSLTGKPEQLVALIKSRDAGSIPSSGQTR